MPDKLRAVSRRTGKDEPPDSDVLIHDRLTYPCPRLTCGHFTVLDLETEDIEHIRWEGECRGCGSHLALVLLKREGDGTP